jgi:hypothetical protein
MRFRLVDGAPDVDRACDRNIGLGAFRPDSDSRRSRITAVLLFQRFLKRSKVHRNLISCELFRRPGEIVAHPSLMLLYLHVSMRAHSRPLMPKFVIEREVPGAENLTDAQWREIAQKSVDVLKGMGAEIQWLHSYVTGDKVYCVYLAADEATIQEHAKRVGLPANRVSAVRRLLEPTSAE